MVKPGVSVSTTEIVQLIQKMFQTVWNLGLAVLVLRDEIAGLLYDDSGDLNARPAIFGFGEEVVWRVARCSALCDTSDTRASSVGAKYL
jgi:hypothetical protein